MAKRGSGNQQRRLYLITLRPLNYARHKFLDNSRRIWNVTAKTPEDRIQLSDDSVLLKLEQPVDWYLGIQILVYCGAVVPTHREAKVDWFDLDRDLLEVRISIRR